MTTLLISAFILTALPLTLLVFLNTNAGIMFLASCAGLVLLESLDPTVVTTAGAIVPGEGEAFVRLAVVLLSLVFAAVMFRNSISKAQLPVHTLIVLLLGAILTILLPSATGVTWLLDTSKESLWQNVNDYRTLLIASGFALSLLAILLAKPAKHGKEKH